MPKTTCRCFLVTFFNLPHQNFDAGFRWKLKSLVFIIERLADLLSPVVSTSYKATPNGQPYEYWKLQ